LEHRWRHPDPRADVNEEARVTNLGALEIPRRPQRKSHQD